MQADFSRDFLICHIDMHLVLWLTTQLLGIYSQVPGKDVHNTNHKGFIIIYIIIYKEKTNLNKDFE